MKLNKKIIGLLSTGLLVSSLMVGCSLTDTGSDSNNTKTENFIKEEKHMTEEERIATLQGLEGDTLTEAYKNLLNEDEINFLNEHGWKIEEEAKYYQDGINLKVPQNYSGNETEVEKFIAEQLNKTAKKYDICEVEFSFTNNTGNDISLLEINFKTYDKNNQSNTDLHYEESIANGETRKIKLYPSERNVSNIEITSIDIRHIAKDGMNYKGCIPGKWYKLNPQPINNVNEGGNIKNKKEGSNMQEQTNQVEIHSCWRCGKQNVNNFDEHWLCDNCYSEKIAHDEDDEEFVNTDDAMIDGYYYCKGCGKQMTDNNNGTYACDDCLNNN